MNPSAEKRKMARMQVDIPVSIFLEKPDRQSEASVLDLSIHGLSLGSSRTLTRGTQFQILFPDQGKLFDKKRIQAEVVRCETLAGFPNRKFKIGVKFLFKFRDSDSSPNESSRALQRFKSKKPELPIAKWIHDDSVRQPTRLNGSDQATWLIRKGEIKAEYCQAIRLSADKKERTIYTVLKIKESHPDCPASISSTLHSDEEFLNDPPHRPFLTEPANGNPLAKVIPKTF